MKAHKKSNNQTLNPKTLSPKTVNPKPYTLNPKLSRGLSEVERVSGLGFRVPGSAWPKIPRTWIVVVGCLKRFKVSELTVGFRVALSLGSKGLGL